MYQEILNGPFKGSHIYIPFFELEYTQSLVVEVFPSHTCQTFLALLIVMNAIIVKSEIILSLLSYFIELFDSF